MSLKAELETWAAALKAYDEESFEKALELFSRIADSSKIFTNIGLIYATVGEHEMAIEKFKEATKLDQFLAVAYFQWGVSNFLLGNFELALDSFEEALLYLRSNQDINYEQLGLKFKLYAAEVVFNKGICQIYLGRLQDGLATLETATQLKATEEHDVIDEAIRDRGEGYNVFSVPAGVLYRPAEKKLRNAGTKDYMGKAKLVATSDPTDIYTEFSGAARRRDGISPAGIYLDPDAVPLSRSVTAPPTNLPQPRELDASARLGGGGVERSKTTINVPPNYRDRIAPRVGELLSVNANTAPGAGRSNSLTVGSPMGIGSLSRGPSTKRGPPPSLDLPPIANAPHTPSSLRPASPPRIPSAAPSSVPSPAPSNVPRAQVSDKGVTDFYDSYLDPYTGIDDAPKGPGSANSAGRGHSPGSLRSAPVSGSTGSIGSMRRKPTGKRSTHNRALSYTYEEEEEGYGSGEYEEAPYEMHKIRVKIHYQDEIRGMALPGDTIFAEFMEKVTAKFDKSLTGLRIKFKDEDGGQMSLRDESDFDMAIETARQTIGKGKTEGKLELWCTDV